MQLVLTNNRLKNLAVRLTTLCMTSCQLSALQLKLHNTMRHSTDILLRAAVRLQTELLPAKKNSGFLTSCDVDCAMSCRT